VHASARAGTRRGGRVVAVSKDEAVNIRFQEFVDAARRAGRRVVRSNVIEDHDPGDEDFLKSRWVGGRRERISTTRPRGTRLP
jgi:hypothetical protein